ncbi:MAG: flagellar hook-associated protein FlgK [Lacunisphaera sp.]
MSGLFSSLSASVGALTAQSRAVEIAGKNLANVNNPDYARQRVLIGSLGTVMTAQGPESMGVAALSIQQLRDSLLDQQVSRESAKTSYYNAQQQSYQRAEAGLGQNIDATQNSSGASSTSDNGVSSAVDDFFNSFQSFAADPTDPGQRQTLLQKTSILTDRIQLASQRLTQVSSDLDSQISTDVTSSNRLLQTIADLNGQISRLEINNPGSAVDLRDQREADIEQLTAQLPVESRTDATGKVQLFSKDSGGNDVILVDGSNMLGTVAFTGTQITAGSPATALALTSGAIQGYLSARDGGVKSIRDSLDQLAQQLVTSVNAAYNPSGTTGNFFNASGTTSATIAMDSSVTATTLKASDGGAAADNTVALAVAQLATQKFSIAGGDAIDGSYGGFLSAAVSNLGQAVAGATARATDQSSIEQLVRSQRDGVSGVSLDEETANLLKYQRAFQASSRVFNTLDDLLDTVVNHLGA